MAPLPSNTRISESVASAMDHVPDPLLIHAGGVWVYANPPAAALLAVNHPAELLGKAITDIVPPDYRDVVERRIAEVERGKPTPRLDQKIVRYDGVTIDVAVVANPMTLADGTAATVMVVRDITDRMTLLAEVRRGEARVRKLLENAFDVLEVIDETGTIRFTSGTAEALLGYGVEDMLGKSLFQFIHPDDRAAAQERFQHVAAQPGRRASARLRLRDKKGAWRVMEGVAVNLLDDADVRGIVINARDVTEKEELARDLEQMQRIESLGRVASTVAHEFSNVLMAVSPWVEVLGRRYPGEEMIQRVAAAMRDAVKNGRRLTEDIRQFGREIAINKNPIEVEEWLAGTANTLRAVLPPKVQLEFCIAPRLAPAVLDADQFGQVLLNLVMNARDAMPDGGTISVDVRMLPRSSDHQRHDWLEIEVRDTGSGMTEETQQRIFEPFFTTKPRGTGLGLAVCRQIVVRHGGRLTVQSTIGQGTSFVVLLPYEA